MDLVMYGVVPVVACFALIYCAGKGSPVALFWLVLLAAIVGLPILSGQGVEGMTKLVFCGTVVMVPVMGVVGLLWLITLPFRGRGR